MQVLGFTKGNSIYKKNITVWGNNDAFIRVYFDGRDEENEDALLSANLDYINKRVDWIENSRSFIEKVLLSNNIIEETEEWIQRANDAKEISNGVYALQDGQTITLPLTKEVLFSDMIVSGMEISYDPNEQEPYTDIFLECRPDFFMGRACFKLMVNYDDSIEECFILSADSPDKPWEL